MFALVTGAQSRFKTKTYGIARPSGSDIRLKIQTPKALDLIKTMAYLWHVPGGFSASGCTGIRFPIG